MRIDFTEWLSRLSDKQQGIVKLLASGETTKAAAQKLGCTAGRVSQHRRQLADSWYAYQS